MTPSASLISGCGGAGVLVCRIGASVQDFVSNGKQHGAIKKTGLLPHNHFGFVLDMGGGAICVLECRSVPRAKHHLGQCVTADGTRVGFNILDVDRMRRAGAKTADLDGERRGLVGDCNRLVVWSHHVMV
ncbi:MAG: hypothetical protein JSR96_03125, partial [Proteobacteria bacterium]|nr:hypothetical protein [Pseudomonadota bacterium]